MRRIAWRLAAALCTAGLILALAWPSMALAEPSRRNTVTKEGDTVTITVPMDLHGALGRQFYNRQTRQTIGAQGLSAVWESGAESIWNSGLGAYLYRGCYTLKVDITIDVIPPGEAGSSDHHHVWLMWSGYRSEVYRGGDSRRGVDNSAPYDQSAEGFWGYIGPLVVAHEVGHFLGLADDYTDVRNSRGQVTGSRPNEGRAGTLMAGGVNIDQEIVDRLGEMVSEQVELPPCFQGTVSIVQEEQIDSGERTATVDVALAISPDESGKLTGLATGSFSLSGVYRDGNCEFSYGMSADVQLEVEANGSDDGPYTIRARQPQIVEETQRYYLCNQAIDFTMRWEIYLDVSDIVFEDGYFAVSEPGLDVVLFYSGR